MLSWILSVGLARRHSAEQQRPFVHGDSDVYLWEPPPEDLLPASVIAGRHPEYPELGRSCYRPEVLERNLPAAGGWMPPEFEHSMPIGGILRAENCGLFGGSRLDVIRHDAETAKRFVHHPNNLPVWAARPENDNDVVLFEQLLLSACLTFHRDRANSVWSDIEARYLFCSYEEATQTASSRGFTHLIAGAKRDQGVIAGLDRCIRREFPAHFDRCMDYLAKAPAAV